MAGEDAPPTKDKYPKCDACSSPITSKTELIQACCGHKFHKLCIAPIVKIRPFCPVCDARIVNDPAAGVSMPTRSQIAPPHTGQPVDAHNASFVAHAGAQDNSSGVHDSEGEVRNPSVSSPVVVDQDTLREMITSIVSAQQSQLFSVLNTQIEQIKANLETSLSRVTLNANPAAPPNVVNIPPPLVTQSPPQMRTLPAVEHQTFCELLGIQAAGGNANSNNRSESNATGSFLNGSISRNRSGAGSNNTASGVSSVSDLNVRPDKVLQIISNWKVKFSGGSNSLSVDNFIYRVEALTAQTLRGNFKILCDNISSLFEGRASDWFWRYHMSVPRIEWPDLTKALRQQYRDSRTDVDIREMIRDRKQRLNEPFDTFYDAIVELTDRLKDPLADNVLVEILRRNLLPEIQHEILNMDIFSVQHLRTVCRRREFFLADVKRKHGFGVSRPAPVQRRISEIDVDSEIDLETPTDLLDECIAEINLICWNCRQSGHRYQDCLADRTVFCYGCGKADTYKPSCKNCLSKNVRFSAQKSALKPTKPKSTETEI